MKGFNLSYVYKIKLYYFFGLTLLLTESSDSLEYLGSLSNERHLMKYRKDISSLESWLLF
jgi:hypothetical protein